MGLGYPEVVQLDAVAVFAAQPAAAVIGSHQCWPPFGSVVAFVCVTAGIAAPIYDVEMWVCWGNTLVDHQNIRFTTLL